MVFAHGVEVPLCVGAHVTQVSHLMDVKTMLGPIVGWVKALYGSLNGDLTSRHLHGAIN